MKNKQKILIRASSFLKSLKETQEEISLKAGISRVSVNKIMNLKDFPANSLLALIDAYPNLDANWLFKGEVDDTGVSLEIPLTEVEKENEALKEKIKSLELSLKFERMQNLLTEDQKKQLVNFNFGVTSTVPGGSFITMFKSLKKEASAVTLQRA